MAVKIKKGNSRLVHADLHVIDGIEFFSRPEIPDLTEGSSDVQHTVVDGERLDTLSRNFYKQDGLYWVLAHRNNIQSFPDDLVPGRRIIVPNASKVRKELF